MQFLDITNVINVSVAIPPSGIANYSINNLVCFTKDTPVVALAGDYATYSSAAEVAAAFGNTSATYLAAVAVFSQSPNIITGGGLFIVIPMEGGETLDDAIVRAETLIYFGACSYAYALDAGELLDAAAIAESSKKILFATSRDSADLVGPSGEFYQIKDQTLNHTRTLYHGATAELDDFRWGYAGRGMSTNFSGVNTTATMNLKSLSGVASDSVSDQTTVIDAKAVGADMYVNIAGASCVLSHGANEFFDNVYNLDWLVGALEVAGFNFLRTTSGKIPQTDEGMDGLKSAYRRVLNQAVANRFVAAGEWTGSDTLGDPEDFRRNIADFGFYIYSQPVALQSQADREERKAPLVQIGIKYAGAIHSSTVIVNINK